MEATGYTTLTRQSGLMREMQVIANNIANSATTGYRQEGVIFSEYVQRTDTGQSVSMATARIQNTSALQGALTRTGGKFDVGIEGDGFFLIQTPQGERLSRAGAFSPSANGDLVTMDGYPVLDAGGAPLFVPPDADDLAISGDGTISTDGRPIGQLGVVMPIAPLDMQREGGVMFRADAGYDPVELPRVKQGFLEGSNVDPVGQIARMIDVQRAYEMGQSFLDAENERVRDALKTFIR
ncbi:flagellar hook-basal body complex protein [Puniceibacterium sp. IMCC21224]|uniref:flagellar hook-basal body complex protein n=1 Tax=Puniceibacterium sp. IMCC21224 TaxID=1618204 RepID=UPI00064D8270|nr:flagellar hook-basal body complex protein [Puniceibacterium sp. IMCC21224]KMK65555.1 flagellar basal-body rod protein FlgF [Puniceibacterium sp. IMCC21224]